MKLLLKLAKGLLAEKIYEWFEEFKTSDVAVKYDLTAKQVNGVRDWVLKKVEKL